MQMSLFSDGKRLSDRAPFPYFGGKSKAKRDILKCYPTDMKELVSPFLGGGSVELLAAARGVRVHAFDKFAPLVRLWQTLLRDAHSVAILNYEVYPYDPAVLKGYVLDGSNAMHIEDDIEFASVAWSMAHQAYGGFFMNGTHYSADIAKTKPYVRGTSTSLEFFNPEKWSDWGNDNMTVECQEWEDTLAQYPNTNLYVDPPYVGNERYYGQNKHKDPFDHEGLAKALGNHGGGWVLSYVEHPIVDELYSDFEVVHPRWAQGTISMMGKRGAKSAKEVYIIKEPCINPFTRLSNPRTTCS